MSPSHGSREQDSLYLPQYGFSETLDFARLVGHNQFLFRVYTPKECSPFFDDSEPFFIAPRFDERCRNPSPGGLKNWEVDGPAAITNATYHDVVRHMDWTTRSLSPYISTSFSAIWSIWEAVRRYHHGVKQDVHIAIIDASAVSHRALTAAYLLSKAPAHERRDGHWKWFRYCQESQTVLVYGAIPGTAILASVPLSDMLRRLPSYFLKESIDKSNPFSRLAWNYTERKPNFRIFCRDMSNNFLRLPHEERLQDATTNAVELAIAFLRPLFHQAVTNANESATEKVSALAFLIAQWPCQWWIWEHTEIWDLVSGTVSAIAEELREKNKSKDVTRLREAVDELEHTLVEYQGRLQHAESQVVKYHKLATTLKQRRAKECLQNIRVSNHLPTPNASPAFNGTWSIDETQIPLPESPLSTEVTLPLNSSTPTEHSSPEYRDQTVDESRIPLHDSSLSTEPNLLPIAVPLTPHASSEPSDTWTIDESKIPLPESPLSTEFRQRLDVVLPTPHASHEHYDDWAIDGTKIILPDLPLPIGISLPPNSILQATPSSPEPIKSRTIDAQMIPLPESPPSAEASLPSTPISLPSAPETPVARPRLSLILEPSQLPPSDDELSSSPTLSFTLSTLTVEEEDETSTVLSTPPAKETIKLLESPRPKSWDLPSKDDSEPESSVCRPTLLNGDDVAELEGVEMDEEYVWVEEEEWPSIHRISPFVGTASYIATGFLVGALITLSLLSHRRVAFLSAT